MNPKRSLTLVLFLLLTAGCFLVIGANRMSAKYLIEVDVQRRIEQEMRAGIASCEHLLGQRERFLVCYRAYNAAETSRVLSDAFLFCGGGTQGSDQRPLDACSAVDTDQVNWIPKLEDNSLLSSFYKQAAWSRAWTGLLLSDAPNGPRVLLPKEAIDNFLGELWSYRNRHLIYVLPLIFRLFVFIALSTVGLVMSPIRALEKPLMRTAAANLD